jgi:hemin uptake protein HemP
MAGERKPVTIHYRRLVRTSAFGSDSLEVLIGRAMTTVIQGAPIRHRYLHRIQQVAESSFFMNVYYDSETEGATLAFGDILHYTQGHLQALIERSDDQTAASLPVKQMPAAQNREYVHSQMFWMVKGDHAFVVQSTSLTSETLENYLQWLLVERAKLLPEGTQIVLAAKFDADVLGGDLGDIKELIIGGVASPDLTAAEPSAQTETDVTHHGGINTNATTVRGHLIEVLKVLLGGQAEVDSVMESVPPDAELRVDVHIGFETKRRKVNRTGLRQLETGLRNVPDSQLRVRSKQGTRGPDGSVRLHHDANVLLLKLTQAEKVIVGSLVDPTDMLRAMYEAYRTFLNNGKITE